MPAAPTSPAVSAPAHGATLHLSAADLAAGLDHVRAAPATEGRLELVVCRPARGERRVLEEATLDLTRGLVEDRWHADPWQRLADGRPDPVMQVTIMDARVAALVAGTPERRAFAGDQLYVDLDLSERNLPAGSRLVVGAAVLEVTEAPHRACGIFIGHFGRDAARFVNGRDGRALRMRGLNASVVVPGTVRPGDPVLRG